MTDDRLALIELLQKTADGDVWKAVAELTLPRLMEFEVEGLCSAGRHERSAARTNDRNGHRPRALETRLGRLDLKIPKIPKLRQGSYYPAFLEPRKTAEKALMAVVQEAWIQGVSTRSRACPRARSTTWSRRSA